MWLSIYILVLSGSSDESKSGQLEMIFRMPIDSLFKQVFALPGPFKPEFSVTIPVVVYTERHEHISFR